jgi:hypothetical protein
MNTCHHVIKCFIADKNLGVESNLGVSHYRNSIKLVSMGALEVVWFLMMM